jgi:hypothetical protein
MEKNNSELNLLNDISILKEYLQSEMHLSEAVNDVVQATIRVNNTSPVFQEGGDIVFVGVGLRISGREPKMGKRPVDWRSMITKTEPTPPSELRDKYDEGTWYGARDNSTMNRLSIGSPYGETLFPGEFIEYSLKLDQKDLPYLNIQVEGSVSRLHLFHISQTMTALNKWTQPLIDEAFRYIDAIDFFAPLLSLSSKIPDLNPQTTIADIQSFRSIVTNTEEDIKKTLLKLRDINPPNKHIAKWIEDIRQYLKSYFTRFKAIQDILVGNDISKMKAVVEEYRRNFS